MFDKIKLKKQLIITIGRQYGSGGRTSAKLLAEKLGIHYYDEEILQIASEESAISEEIFRLADEMTGNNILRKITRQKIDEFNIDTKNLTSPDNLFKFQSSVIRDLAKQDDFIILGRCANFVLEDQHKDKVLRIFLYADFETRVKRIMEQEKINEEMAIGKIKKRDKNRSDYYRYFTGCDLLEPYKYDLMINTTTIGFDEILNIILSFIITRGFAELVS